MEKRGFYFILYLHIGLGVSVVSTKLEFTRNKKPKDKETISELKIKQSSMQK